MSKTILLADDSLTIQKVVELTFSDTDFELIATSSGDELLERLPTSGADIVICDTIMPGIDGYSVCQAIKSESATLHIPVILMTGTFEPFDRDRALAAGCSEIVTKPFEARNLVETVERLVSGQGVAAPAPEAFAGSVAPPKFQSAVEPPAQQEPEAGFGTMLSPPPDVPAEVVPPQMDGPSDDIPEHEEASSEVIPPTDDFSPEVTPPEVDFSSEVTHPEEGFPVEVIPVVADPASEVIPIQQDDELDFTSTGFAEMEAAAAQMDASPPVLPDHGLEYDASPYEEPEPETFGSPDFEAPEPTQPIPTGDYSEGADPFGAASPGMFGESGEPEPEPPVEEPAFEEPAFAEPEVEEPAYAEPEVEEPAFEEPAAEEPEAEPFEASPPDSLYGDAPVEVQVHPPEGFPVDTDPVAEPEVMDEPEPIFEPEPEPEPIVEPEPEPIIEPEPLNEAEPVVEAMPENEPEFVPDIMLVQDEAADEVVDAPVAQLSDADIERIAQRVVELSGDRLEKIAWDVIPDMAEIVVRERLRELEDEIDNSTSNAEPN